MAAEGAIVSCGQCGHGLGAGARFCANCGTALGAIPQAVPGSPGDSLPNLAQKPLADGR